MPGYVSIDIETTGLDPETCQILEFAAVYDFDINVPIAELPVLHHVINHKVITGEPYALAMNKNILEAISLRDNNLCTIDNLVWEFRSWYENISNDLGPMVIAGKNFGSFDLQFLKKIPNWSIIRHDHRFLDPGMLFWNYWTDDFKTPSQQKCLDRCGAGVRVSHTAVSDAQQVVYLIRKSIEAQGKNALWEKKW